MGCFYVYCPLCGMRLNSGMFRDIAKAPVSTTRWMERCIVLVRGHKPQHGFMETHIRGQGTEATYFLCYDATKEDKFDPVGAPGAAVHTDCWRAARKALMSNAFSSHPRGGTSS